MSRLDVLSGPTDNPPEEPLPSYEVEALDEELRAEAAQIRDEYAAKQGRRKRVAAAMSVFGGPGSGPHEGAPHPHKGRSNEPNVVDEKLIAVAPVPTPEQKASIDSYVGLDGYDINAQQRGVYHGSENHGAEEIAQFQKDADAISSYLEGASLPEDVVLWRGVRDSMDAEGNPVDIMAGLKPGDVFMDHGFLSTTTEEENFRAPTKLEIHAPAGSEAASIRGFSPKPGDHEVLFQRGTSMRVDEIRGARSQDRRNTIVVTILPRPVGQRGDLFLEPAAARARRIAEAVAHRRSQLGGPGSGPREGVAHPHGGKGKKFPDPTPDELRQITEIKGDFKRSIDKRIADGDAVMGPDGKIVYQGELGAQRAAVVDKWVGNADPVDNPTVTVLGGGPGSGKTTVRNSGLATDMPSVGDPANGVKGEAVSVASDDLKEQEFKGPGPMGDYERLLALHDKDAAAWVHAESNSLGQEIYAKAMDEGKNIVHDTTANTSVEEMTARINEAHDAGRQINAVYVTIPTEVAVNRATIRREESGRGVPDHVIRGIHASVSDIVPKIADKFDSIQLFSNDQPQGQPPTLVMSNTLGGQPTVQDPDRYQEFLDKANRGYGQPAMKSRGAEFADESSATDPLSMYYAVLLGEDFTGPESARPEWDAIVAAVNEMPAGIVREVPSEMPALVKSAAIVAGGPGSGPHPGSDNPWYHRGGKGKEPVTKGTGTKEDPIVTSDVNAAAKAIYEGKHVQLNQPDQVATLLDKLHEIGVEAKAKGEKAPLYNLCNVSVPDTNLFCADNIGIPRVEMPQLSGVPIPGSEAEKLPRDPFNDKEVNASPQFLQHLLDSGITVTEENRLADHLRATQNELDGVKVAKVTQDIEQGVKWPTERPIFVTKDGYIIDGHHTWAAVVGSEFETGKQLEMPVHVIDMNIVDALAAATEFSKDLGIPQKSAKAETARARRIAEAVARRRAELGGPGSGPRPGQAHPREPGAPVPAVPGPTPSEPSTPVTAPVSKLMEAIREKGGMTIHPVTGYEPDTGFAVSFDGHSSITPTKDFFAGPKGQEAGRQIIKDWLRENRDLFNDVKVHIGAWINSKHDDVVLDPSEVVADQAEAERLGIERDQEAIYNLATGEEIPLGGTGGRPQ